MAIVNLIHGKKEFLRKNRPAGREVRLEVKKENVGENRSCRDGSRKPVEKKRREGGRSPGNEMKSLSSGKRATGREYQTRLATPVPETI